MLERLIGSISLLWIRSWCSSLALLVHEVLLILQVFNSTSCLFLGLLTQFRGYLLTITDKTYHCTSQLYRLWWKSYHSRIVQHSSTVSSLLPLRELPTYKLNLNLWIMLIIMPYNLIYKLWHITIFINYSVMWILYAFYEE